MFEINLPFGYQVWQRTPGDGVPVEITGTIDYEDCPIEPGALRAHCDLNAQARAVLLPTELVLLADAVAYSFSLAFKAHNRAHPENKIRDMFILVYPEGLF